MTPRRDGPMRASRRAVALAWLVHAYTASGLICAALMAASIVRGGDEAFRLAFALMAVATAIDATDGWLARLARVAEVVPEFDGRRLDDLVDFLTYTCLPLLLVWRAGLVGAWGGGWLIVPLVASAYGFSQAQAKTDDHFFLGFPSYWNIVAFYLYLLGLPAGGALVVLLAFAGLTFVPARYLYPSGGGGLNRATRLAGLLWASGVVATLWLWREAPRALVVSTLAFPAYYLGISWFVSLRAWRRRR